ncbi:hypothetical protein SacazDRAFT_01580 [Saccharomonospora azurea NA-128]|uniref:Uncharacterized protein n=1 Tax=Saccharomonospora azurea NA-128 TaxID=882081 RepID=H8G9E6_9PSEU|nr:hypothetical protein SacazDRAFT_01580 [Saccharomonospora azurea NA-128]
MQPGPIPRPFITYQVELLKVTQSLAYRTKT